MKFKDKKHSLLKALYERRFDGKHYNAVDLLNPFTISDNEAFQLATALEDEGLINVSATKSKVYVEIQPRGIELIEEELLDDEKYEPNDSFTSDEAEFANKGIDEILSRIKRIEVGQQIIYNDLVQELEELKALTGVLGKKNWLQTLKGKLLDAGLGYLSDQVAQIIIDTFKSHKLLG